MKYVFTLVIGLITMMSFAQKKQLWAKSFLGEEAPKLIVEQWLTEAPKTEGKFVLIDFWATWCGPCKKAIPELNAYQKEFKDHLVVIGLSDETEATINKMKTPKMEYYSAIDTKERLERQYKVQGIPHCVIINPKGIVVWEGWPHLEGYELTAEVIKELIEAY
ncbi:TlpA disulfide reductase family protein [Ichthyenterobacterium sp. W332]|uniref:TlpA disulfide reductase family protein n=1 Tax=Microcosmobacter mediterraneus TaxID=3075607 RepID=A0ABU2YI88_9FLAO|nr:TlpA disulfide reductase family protein [Ichthyenterobacterium sp. W332]MDT0557507.1 TlpA disulfide reductase family protein [Ichthyenterobacterium sp. W332]